MKILLAEDNPADVYLLRESLELNRHISLVVASDGEEAQQAIANCCTGAAEKPDLIILDLNLPKSDGADVLRMIRHSEEMRYVPVVILTSSDSPRDRAAVERLGADSYITKPSDLDEFMALGGKLLAFADVNRRRAAARAGA